MQKLKEGNQLKNNMDSQEYLPKVAYFCSKLLQHKNNFKAFWN